MKLPKKLSERYRKITPLAAAIGLALGFAAAVHAQPAPSVKPAAAYGTAVSYEAWRQAEAGGEAGAGAGRTAVAEAGVGAGRTAAAEAGGEAATTAVAAAKIAGEAGVVLDKLQLNLHPQVKRAVKPGSAAPVLQLNGMDGKAYQLGGKRAKPLLLNFWASWCDPCRLEAPDMQRLAEKYKDKLDIYGVNVTAYDDEASAAAFVKQYGLTFPILFDREEQAFSNFDGAAFPTQVLIDRNGVVKSIVVGLLPPEQLEEKIRVLTGD